MSWGWESETPGPSRFVDEQEYQGTLDPAAYLSVPAAIQFCEEHEWERVRRTCHELARNARTQITALTGLEPIFPESPEWYAQMVTLPLPPCRAEALKQRLYDEFRIEVPIITWQDRQFIRVSLQGYNDQADVEALVAALKVLLPGVSPP